MSSSNSTIAFPSHVTDMSKLGNVYAGQGVISAGTANVYAGTRLPDVDTTSAANNTIFGSLAGSSLTNGTNNTLIGTNAGSTMTSTSLGAGANANVFVGTNAGEYQTETQNVGVGYDALLGVTGSSDGQFNNALGASALKSLTAGDYNVAIGGNAGLSVTAGNSNTTVGNRAGDAITTGSLNVCVGAMSNVAATNAGSIAIGYSTTVNGDSSVAIGNNVDITGNNKIVLGTTAQTTYLPGMSFPQGKILNRYEMISYDAATVTIASGDEGDFVNTIIGCRNTATGAITFNTPDAETLRDLINGWGITLLVGDSFDTVVVAIGEDVTFTEPAGVDFISGTVVSNTTSRILRYIFTGLTTGSCTANVLLI